MMTIVIIITYFVVYLSMVIVIYKTHDDINDYITYMALLWSIIIWSTIKQSNSWTIEECMDHIGNRVENNEMITKRNDNKTKW